MNKLIVFLILCSFTMIENEDSIIGKWYTTNNRSIIKIYKKEGKFYGITEKAVKKENVGKMILKDFVYNKEKWVNGKLYYPKKDKYYNCEICIKNCTIMKLNVSSGFLSKTITWKKIR